MTTINTETQTEQDQCGICYTELDNKNTIVTPCNHSFCTGCFFTWLGRKETCALCRAVLLSDTVFDERLLKLQDIQDELVVNYRYLHVLKKNVKEKKTRLKHITNDSNALMDRQLRMRSLLEQTRMSCENMLSHSKALKQTMKLQNKSLQLLKTYKKEWKELSNEPEKQEEKREEKREEKQEEKVADEELDIAAMENELDHMVRLERIRARNTLRRLNERVHIETSELAEDGEDTEDTEIEYTEAEAEIEDEAEDETEDETVGEAETEDGTEDDTEGETDGEDSDEYMPDASEEIPRRFVRLPTRSSQQSPIFTFGQNTPSTTGFSLSDPSMSWTPIQQITGAIIE